MDYEKELLIMGMGLDEDWDVEQEHISRSDFDWYKSIEKDRLNKMTDVKLLNKILHEKKNRNFINNIVPNRKFPAYTIAEKLSKSTGELTANQRRALTNVLSHYYTLARI